MIRAGGSGWPRLTLVAVVLALPGLAVADKPASPGERIYRGGVLPSGQPLRGTREGGVGVEGMAAACVTCHRRSGLGGWEGQTVIPPIIGRYLFRPGARNVEDPELPHVQGYVPHRKAYTDATLAVAVRQGIDQEGRKLSYLMPRYALDAGAMAALIAYLKELTSGPVPGVSGDTLHFATVITPDADPVARGGMLAVLKQFFADKNAGYRGETPAMRSSRGVMYRVQRRWTLHVWELAGAPETWERQLEDKLAATPVFAVISGIGGRTWAPVHRFCERAGVPCLLPNVLLPVVAEQDFYPVYYDKGVLLEAALVAERLKADGATGGSRGAGRGAARRLVQVFRGGDVGEEAAAALGAAASSRGLEVTLRRLGGGDPRRELEGALADVTGADAVMLWLRPGEIAALPAQPPRAGRIVVSGLMGGLEGAPLAGPWRAAARMTYPYDLPDARRVRMNFPLGWFKVRHIPVVDERVQTDTYLACVILSEALGHMLDSFVRDYLLERLEVLVSHRLVNGHYPRLGLGPGQRFASKGGHLVRFAQPAGPRLVADTPWIVP